MKMLGGKQEGQEQKPQQAKPVQQAKSANNFDEGSWESDVPF
jgi:hypothetical protein